MNTLQMKMLPIDSISIRNPLIVMVQHLPIVTIPVQAIKVKVTEHLEGN